MVQRKYIAISVKHLIFTYIFVISNSCFAGAWLAGENQYKFITSVSSIDQISKQLRNQRSEILLAAYRIRKEIYQKKLKLTKEDQELLKELILACDHLNDFNDDFMIYNDLEYGISPSQSMGMELFYIQDRVMQYKWNAEDSSDHDFKNNIAKTIGVYYKYSLYNDNNWQLSFAPKVTYYKKNKIDEKTAVGIGVYLGHSGETKSGKKNFVEFGYSLSRTLDDRFKNTTSQKITFTEGGEIMKGLSLNNYLEYSFTSNSALYSAIMYEQLAVAKDFMLGNNNKQQLTIQIGYYWKSSLRYEMFRVSGPIISAWINL